MKFRMFIVLTVCFCLLMPAFSQVEQTVGGINYGSGPFNDPLGRFTLTVPAGWQGHAEEKGGEVNFVTFRDPYFSSFSFRVIEVGANGSAKTLRDNAVKAFQSSNKTFKIISEAEITVDNCPAVWLHMSQVVFEGNLMVADEYYFVKDKLGYIIHFDTADTGYKTFSSDYKSIISSFKFGKAGIKK